VGSNVIDIDNAHYLRLIDLEIWSEAPDHLGIDGINVGGTNVTHITFEGLNIHNVSGNGISVFTDRAHHLTLRRSEISHCVGSGLYWGYPNRDIVSDVLVENNYIHDCPKDPASATHYGIQYKGWGYRARIINNVLHDVGGTTRSGIIVYYGRKPLQGDDPADVNIVRGNIIWNARNEGVTVMSDAIIENNIICDAAIGINIQTYTDESFSGNNYVENLTIRNNTVFRCGSVCINVGGWTSLGSRVSFTGNAAFQDNVSKAAFGGSTGTATCRGNVRYGTSALSSGVTAGNDLGDFMTVSAAIAITDADFYPSASSALLEQLSSSGDWPLKDFNGTERPSGVNADAGAYERNESTNSGGAIAEDFKTVPVEDPPEILSISVSNEVCTLTWPYTEKWIYVERAMNLLATNWVIIDGPIYATNALPSATATRAFFRLRMER